MTEPQTPLLRARNVPAVAPKAAEADAALDVMMRRAQAVARAGDAVPKSYRQNPGAVLLAAEWAQPRGLDLLTAIQGVTFISGKPVIDATLQRALAKRAGYRVKPTQVSAESATVQVWEGDDLLGEATYTMADAKLANLAQKDNWRQNPQAMLVARATTQAMRWYAPDVMVGVFTDDEVDSSASDAVAVLDPQPQVEPEPVEGEVTEAELVEEPEAEVAGLADDGTPADDDTVAAVRDALAEAKSTGTYQDVVEQLRAEAIPLQPHKMTAVQAARALWLAQGGQG